MEKEFYEKKKLTEQEINLIKNRLNHNKLSKTKLYDKKWLITKEQTEKGLNYLKNQWLTPKGLERKTNPFGYKETKVIVNFKNFELLGFYDTANQMQNETGINFYVPIYRVNSKKGNYFEYYCTGINKIMISG